MKRTLLGLYVLLVSTVSLHAHFGEEQVEADLQFKDIAEWQRFLQWSDPDWKVVKSIAREGMWVCLLHNPKRQTVGVCWYPEKRITKESYHNADFQLTDENGHSVFDSKRTSKDSSLSRVTRIRLGDDYVPVYWNLGFELPVQKIAPGTKLRFSGRFGNVSVTLDDLSIDAPPDK